MACGLATPFRAEVCGRAIAGLVIAVTFHEDHAENVGDNNDQSPQAQRAQRRDRYVQSAPQGKERSCHREAA
jgi:hypothetical protein